MASWACDPALPRLRPASPVGTGAGPTRRLRGCTGRAARMGRMAAGLSETVIPWRRVLYIACANVSGTSIPEHAMNAAPDGGGQPPQEQPRQPGLQSETVDRKS